MTPRPLGRSGLATPPLVLGGNLFGWTLDEPSAHAVLDAFVDAGFALVDTADVYSRWVPGNTGGESEAIIGRWLAKGARRDGILIATKVGGETAAGAGLSAKHIHAAVDASLRRLRTDHIDLYQVHYPDDGVAYEETLGAFADLIAAGKVRAIGVSNHDVARMEAAMAASAASGLPRYETIQPLYNLYDRAAFERDLAPFVRRHGVGVISFKALANGFLSGRYRSEADVARSSRPGANRPYLTPRGQQILAALDAVAARLGATPAQIALAWVIAQPDVTAPIASARSPEQVRELAAAVRLTLDGDALATLDAASAT